MKKYITLFMILVSIFLLTGCGTNKYKYHSNYTKNEVFELVNSYISEETNGLVNYNLKIIKTEPLEVCKFAWNVCHEYTTVKGANKYTVELTNKTTGRKESQVIVMDRYYNENTVITPNVFSENFEHNREYYERYDKFINLLNKYNSIKYKLINDEENTVETKTIQYGYIYYTNTLDLEEFLRTIEKRQYEYYWDFIITNDINEYNMLINNHNSFTNILDKYEKTNKVYQIDEIDFSSFNNNSSVIIENTSQGSSSCVNSVLTKK